MSQFNFTYVDTDTGVTVHYSAEAGTWYDALNHFVSFLRGAGYRLEDDSVGINTKHHYFVEDDYQLLLTNVTTFEGKED